MEAKRPKKKRRVLRFFAWAAGCLVVIVAITLFIAMAATSKPTKVARNFLGDLSDQQLEQAYNLTSSQFKASVPPEQFVRFTKQYPILTSPSNISFSHRSVENGVATVAGKITSTTGDVAPITVMVIKEKDDWRVLSLSLRPEDSPTGFSD
ncbi:DUF4864 domain-containing protein [Bdellovibrionota bacterium]